MKKFSKDGFIIIGKKHNSCPVSYQLFEDIDDASMFLWEYFKESKNHHVIEDIKNNNYEIKKATLTWED